jgi:hypothetical protein
MSRVVRQLGTIGGRLPLPDSLATTGPGVVGATGGSGTRVPARIARAGGMFVGTNLNAHEDAVDFGGFSDRWIDLWLRSEGAIDDETASAMRSDLEEIVRRHCEGLPDGTPWGWKEPRSIYLLPFFDEALPAFRFVHFVRDGRDMAFSENQNQLVKHGQAALGASAEKLSRPLRSIALWNAVNVRAADYGEAVLGDRYLRVRFEDLCSDPGGTARRLYDFFGLSGDAEEVGRTEVSPPGTLGRWLWEKPAVVRELEEIARPGLTRFGYL